MNVLLATHRVSDEETQTIGTDTSPILVTDYELPSTNAELHSIIKWMDPDSAENYIHQIHTASKKNKKKINPKYSKSDQRNRRKAKNSKQGKCSNCDGTQIKNNRPCPYCT